MKDTDFIYDDEYGQPGDLSKKNKLDTKEDQEKDWFEKGEKVLINGDEYSIEKLEDSKDLGIEGIETEYTWYRAKKKDGGPTNLFFYGTDFDCEEENDKAAKKWFDTYDE